MPIWGSKLIFPVDGAVADTNFGDEFRTIITDADGAESSDSRWSLSRAVIDISGMQFTNEQRRLLRTFHRAVLGAGERFLFRRADDDEYEMQNELLGIGDGVRTQFQCRIYGEIQGKGGEYVVRYLDHDYPPVGLDVQGRTTRPTSYVQIRVAGVLKTLGVHYTVNRETGLITFLAGHVPTSGQEVRATGGFYVLVRFDGDRIPLKPLGSGWYEAPEGTTLIEPKGHELDE